MTDFLTFALFFTIHNLIGMFALLIYVKISRKPEAWAKVVKAALLFLFVLSPTLLWFPLTKI